MKEDIKKLARRLAHIASVAELTGEDATEVIERELEEFIRKEQRK